MLPQGGLTKFIVPRKIKQKCLAKLWSLGIRYESLFPDAEGAAYVIDFETKTIFTEMWSRNPSDFD